MADLLTMTGAGLYCAAGDFHIDPQRSVDRAIITHAHTDHARSGSRSYLTATDGVRLLEERLGPRARVQAVPYGQPTDIHGVTVSLHPAGHILGSAQVRVESRGEVWVVSGDYKTERDATCAPFEPVRCHAFITEATFGTPAYRWRPQAEVFAEINAWWRANVARRRLSVLCAYSLGKAQRVLAGLDARIGPIVVHPHAAKFLALYAAAGVRFPPVAKRVTDGALVIAPSVGAAVRDLTGSAPIATAFASGWMLRRGAARGYGVQTGFALSDHADWDGLTATIRETGAERVGVAHGDPVELLRWLRAQRRRGWVVAHRTRPARGQLELPFAED